MSQSQIMIQLCLSFSYHLGFFSFGAKDVPQLQPVPASGLFYTSKPALIISFLYSMVAPFIMSNVISSTRTQTPSFSNMLHKIIRQDNNILQIFRFFLFHNNYFIRKSRAPSSLNYHFQELKRRILTLKKTHSL